MQAMIILTGSYNFFNLLIITLNIVSFDDDFLRTFIPDIVLNFFDLNPIATEVKELSEIIIKSIKNDNDHTNLVRDRQNNYTLQGLEEYQKTSNSIINEIMIFQVNFFAVSTFSFFFLFPYNEIFQPDYNISNANYYLWNYILNPNFMNIFVLFTGLCIMYKYFYNLFGFYYNPLIKPKPQSIMIKSIVLTKNISFLCLMCAYLIFSINTLYSSNSIKISDEYKSVVNLVKDYSNNIVNNFTPFMFLF